MITNNVDWRDVVDWWVALSSAKAMTESTL